MSYENFTTRAKSAVRAANNEAFKDGASSITSHHLLLGILHDESCLGASIIIRSGIKLGDVRDAVKLGKLSVSSDSSIKEAVQLSQEEASHCKYVDTGHLLLGLLRSHDGMAFKALYFLGLNFAAASKIYKERQVCSSCEVPFDEHLGITGVCEKLQKKIDPIVIQKLSEVLSAAETACTLRSLDDVSDVMKELKTLIGGSVRFETKDTARDWEQLLTSEFGRNK